MGTTNGVGYGPYTSLKQNQFRKWIKTHLSIVRGILSRHSWTYGKYVYYDITAGPGQYMGDDKQIIDGSPLVFLEEAQQAKIPFEIVAIEKDHDNYLSLNNLIGSERGITVYHGDHTKILPRIWGEIDKPCYGLLYADPTYIVPWRNIFDLLRQMAVQKRYSRLDFMLYIHAASYKRSRGMKPLQECLLSIGKKEWIIRSPQGKHQHVFLIGTNWTNFPAWEAEGFYNIKSRKGQEIFDCIGLTKDEIKKKRQMELPLTEPMRSI